MANPNTVNANSLSHDDLLGVRTGSRPISRLTQPFRDFARLQASGGILLLVCTVIALIWANSPFAESYTKLFATIVTVSAGTFVISKPLLLWINDFLMAVFFFVVGLEIKREVLFGELSSLRQAALPIAAGIGGMILPAVLYLILNLRGPGAGGWGVPMATDIAFALGVLTLLGNRVPSSLKVFLAAFAIADDIGAVLVIALFYTAKVSLGALLFGFFLLALSALANWSGVRNPLIYALIGLFLWVAFLKSGIHATVAGVLLAMTIPARAHLASAAFMDRVRTTLVKFERGEIASLSERHEIIYDLEHAAERVQTPLHRMEHSLHPWVTFFIMPVFALANAGVTLIGPEGTGFTGIAGPVPLGIILGLVLGKPIGVTLLAWLAVRVGIAAKPEGVTWLQIHGVGWLGGIGFTMALFIAGLAFPNAAHLGNAKLGILTGSLIAGIVGFVLLYRIGNSNNEATESS
ncbi:MAG: Na+/H+ antiporter NhaA [Armatimonadaceae bacterium]